MSVRIALLGPLYVESEGIERRVPPAKQRALLAGLAVKANDVVPVETLTEAMWGGDSPPSKLETTRTYIHRLRGKLGAAAGQRIVTQAPGYMLRVGPNELDLMGFESLVKDGMKHIAEGDWPRASARLSEAEGLWRGTPLGDIPSGYARDRYVEYLEQKRLSVAESRIEAEVRASRHGAAAAVPELFTLTAWHPERERLWLLLMLALYRSGRQAEALSAFGHARHAITTGYGVDPGPELHGMQQRVYAQDLTLLSEPLERFCFA
jgi:DNA-binding SARP family transcriptional activator